MSRPSPTRLGTALPLLALLGLGAGAAPARAGDSDEALSAEALEARHGLRLTRVAVSGDGGLVDLRFRVVDPEKARPLLAATGPGVRLRLGADGPTVEAPHHGGMQSVRLARDAPCFVLFPNAGGAVRRGGRVDVAFGAVTVRSVAVE